MLFELGEDFPSCLEVSLTGEYTRLHILHSSHCIITFVFLACCTLVGVYIGTDFLGRFVKISQSGCQDQG